MGIGWENLIVIYVIMLVYREKYIFWIYMYIIMLV